MSRSNVRPEGRQKGEMPREEVLHRSGLSLQTVAGEENSMLSCHSDI